MVTFDERVLAALNEPMDIEQVSVRPGSGSKTFNYMKVEYIIRQLNRVLGYGRWQYDLTSIKDVGNGKIIATVRLAVKTGEGFESIYYEDVGFGSGDTEKAYKEAVSDALKRCARNLGDQFGLALWDANSEENTTVNNRGKTPSAASASSTPATGVVSRGRGRSGNTPAAPSASTLTTKTVAPKRGKKSVVNPADYPAPNLGKEYVCEAVGCTETLTDNDKYSAAEQAFYSTKETGNIYCQKHRLENGV